ncbi:MAG: adenylate/guanylate cyclase domain-containing protein, partial [Chthoniobacterales bacterium]
VTSDGPRGDCLRAVRAALAMLESVEAMRRRWRSEARAELQLGIGLNFGSAIFGNIGSEEKMEPTVIGDTVNLASRLEGTTKQYGVPVVLSGSVAEHVGVEIPLCLLDIVRVKGRAAPVEIFTVPMDGDARPYAPDWLARHMEAWDHYRAARFRDASACFELSQLGATMVTRCRELLDHPPAPGWEPVKNLESK